MDTNQIEANLIKISENISQDTFIYDLLLAYGLPKASITRLQSGNLNLSKNEGEILWKKQLFFKVETKADLHETIDAITSGSEPVKHNPRFIIVTDWETLLAVDTRTNDDLSPNFRTMTKMRFPVNLKQRRSQYEETIHRRTNHQGYSTA